jgi:Flp pilus assembly protein TadB
VFAGAYLSDFGSIPAVLLGFAAGFGLPRWILSYLKKRREAKFIDRFSSPDYITVLWTDRLGQIMLAGSAVWMSIGIMVMKKMINFNF